MNHGKIKFSITRYGLRVLNNMLCSIDERKVTILVLLNLLAAFDTVVHDILLHCLCHRFGVTGRALDWLRSYFTSRSERVTVNGTCSREHIITCGVPQGSVLGQILFLAYVSPLGDELSESMVWTFTFSLMTLRFICHLNPGIHLNKK